jgi:hypothetical protein
MGNCCSEQPKVRNYQNKTNQNKSNKSKPKLETLNTYPSIEDVLRDI